MVDHDAVRSSTRRIVGRALGLVLPLCALAAATPWLWREWHGRTVSTAGRGDRAPTEEEIQTSRRADDRLAEVERKAWGETTTIVPGEVQRDDSGERVRWFAGFGLSVESKPSGARVLVNGEEMGTTPLTTSVNCGVGEEVRVEIHKDGFRPTSRVTHCRADQLVELAVDLR